MERFKMDLAEIKGRREQSEVAHIEELTQLMEEKERGERALDRLQQDLKKQQGDSLQLYAEVIKKDAAKIPEATDSSYVMRMQAQLCKCMHSMGIVENQMELVKETCEELIKSLKDAITNTLEEKSQVELLFMNELVLTDNQRRKAETSLKDKLDKLRDQIEELELRLEEIEDEKEDLIDEEQDEDEEQEKEELRKEARERADEIRKIKQNIKEQRRQMKKFRSDVGEDANGDVEGKYDMPEEEVDDDEDGDLTEDESIDYSSS